MTEPQTLFSSSCVMILEQLSHPSIPEAAPVSRPFPMPED
jgi:hypothetical protein